MCLYSILIILLFVLVILRTKSHKTETAHRHKPLSTDIVLCFYGSTAVISRKYRSNLPKSFGEIHIDITKKPQG